MRFIVRYFVLLALLAPGAVSIRTTKGCGAKVATTDFGDEAVGRTLLQAEVEDDKIGACSWHVSTKSCAMSMAAMASYYAKIESLNLRDFGFSIQDCSIVKDAASCTKRKRFGCYWSKASSTEGRCEPMVLSEPDMMTGCYDSGENIFFRDCEELSRKECRRFEAHAGCNWNLDEYCSFDFNEFIKDMEKLANRRKDNIVTTTFNATAVTEIRNLADRRCPSASQEDRCLEIDGCFFDDETEKCIPRPAHVMKLATTIRTDPDMVNRCNLMDLVLTGDCENATDESSCKRKEDNKCFWDFDLEHCMPGPALVFETLSRFNQDLWKDFEKDMARCKEQKEQKSCEAVVAKDS